MLSFRGTRPDAIIESVRRHRVLTAATVLSLLAAACTAEPSKPSFNPTPKPTRPGQAVIIAGDPKWNAPPRDGEYALETGANSDGGLAFDEKSGRLYIGIAGMNESLVAEIGTDGRVTLLPPFGRGDQIFFANGTLWMLESREKFHFSRASRATLKGEEMLQWDKSSAGRVRFLDKDGKAVERPDWKHLDEGWEGVVFALRGDGVPVIVNRFGDLFLVTGKGEMRQWRPAGYDSALRTARNGGDFSPTYMAAEPGKGLVILGRYGVIRLEDGAPAIGVRFPHSVKKLPPWQAVTRLPDGSLLLLGGTDASHREPRPTLVRRDGSLIALNFGGPKWCHEFDGTLAAVASADPGGLIARPDGTYVISDRNCARIYSFRLPDGLTGSAPGN
ncbi:hypothetical protein ACQEU3_19110 [Spirillospora sp. CA-253888]